MITQVDVQTTQGTTLSLPLDDPSGGVYIQEIEGLLPVNATLVSSAFAQTDGEQYQSSRRETRNVKLKLGINPDYIFGSVSDVRWRLYGYLMPKSQVNLRFYMSTGLIVDIQGRIESCEGPMFTNDPELTVSVICYDPDFIDLTPVRLPSTTTDLEVDTTIRYDGTVETGFQLVLNVNRAISAFTVYSRTPDNIMRTLDFVAPLSIGDTLTISTLSGAKGATLTRAGNDSSLLYAISPQSNWIELQPGINYFRVYATGAGIPFELVYMNRYGGL